MKRWLTWFFPLVLLLNGCILPSEVLEQQTDSSISVITQPEKSINSADTKPGVQLQVLGHLGGAALTVAIRDHYALLGFSYELVVLDLADPTQPQWVAALPIPATDIALTGRYAYVVGRNSFAVVNVDDPARPVLVNTLVLPDTGAAAVVVTTAYAYVAVYGDLYTIALADPTKPVIIGVNRLAVRITGMATADNELYLVTDDDFQRLEISNPAQPIRLELIASQRFSYGPVIVDDTIYFGSKTAIWMKGVGSVMAPRVMDLRPGLDWANDIAVVNGIAYLSTGFQGLSVWDITDPAHAVALGAYPLGGLTKAVVAQDGYLYTIDCDEGLRIFDASNPTDLITVSLFTPLGISYKLAVSDAFAYVAGGFAGGLHQVALTNSAMVHTIAGHLLRSEVHDLALVDDYLYVAAEGGIGIIDLATSAMPQIVASYPFPNAWAITAAGSSLYVSDPEGNLWLVDRTEPAHLTTVAAYPALGYANTMAVEDTLAYIAHKDAGMRLLSIGVEGELTLVGLYPSPMFIRKIVVVDGYAYLASGKQGLDVVDVSDPTAPRLVSRYDTPGEALDLAIQWPYLLLADGDGGLRVFDMTQPPHLTAVAHYATADCIYQVVSANGLIYVAQPLAGFTILRLTPPSSAPKEVP